jgi:methoxymalonate biosynthesis acyl carrier protein
MTTNNIKSRLTAFFIGTYKDRALGEEDDIFALGFGNSLFAMQLVDFVEREFGIELEDEDLDIQYFTTIRSIAGLVERKRAAAHH